MNKKAAQCRSDIGCIRLEATHAAPYLNIKLCQLDQEVNKRGKKITFTLFSIN